MRASVSCMEGRRDAINLPMDHNIDLIFLDDFGDPCGRVWYSKLGSTTLIRRKQPEFA